MEMNKRAIPKSLKIPVIGLVFIVFLQFSQGEIKEVLLKKGELKEVEFQQQTNFFFSGEIEEIDNNYDFFVVVKDKQNYSEQQKQLDVFLSHQADSQTDNSSSCSQKVQNQYNICMIQGLKLKKYFIVKIESQQECSFDLQLIYKQTTTFQVPDGLYKQQISFQSDVKGILLNFQRNESKNNKPILITAKVLNIEKRAIFKKVQFQMFVSQENDQNGTISQMRFNGKWISQNVIALKIPIKSISLINLVKLILVSPSKIAEIELSVTIDEKINLVDDLEVYGMVEPNEATFYSIDLKSLTIQQYLKLFKGKKSMLQNEDNMFNVNLQFNLSPFSGEPELFIYYGNERPNKLEKYNYKQSQSKSQGEITLKKEDLNKGNNANNKIFIAIKANNFHSFFKLKMKTYDQATKFLKLQFLQPIRSSIKKGAVVTYSFREDDLDKIKYKFILISEQGNTDLFVKQQNKSDPINVDQQIKENIQSSYNNSLNEQKYFDGVSINEEGVDIVQIGSKQLCSLKESIICEYLVSIYGIEDQSQYQIIVQSNQKQIYNPLSIEYPNFVDLELGEKLYFYFIPIDIDQSVNKIEFEVKFLSGYAQILSEFYIQPTFYQSSLEQINNGKPLQKIEINKEFLFEGEQLDDYYQIIQLVGLQDTKAIIRVELSRVTQVTVGQIQEYFGYPSILMIGPNSSEVLKIYPISDKTLNLVAKSGSFFTISQMNKKSTNQIIALEQRINNGIIPKRENNKFQFQSCQIENQVNSFVIFPEIYNFIIVDTTIFQNLEPIFVEVFLFSTVIYLQTNQLYSDILDSQTIREYRWDLLQQQFPYYLYISSTPELFDGEFKVKYFVDNKQIEQLNNKLDFSIDKTLNAIKLKKNSVLKFQIKIETKNKRMKHIVQMVSPKSRIYLSHSGQLQMMPFEQQNRFFYFQIDKTKDYLITAITDFLKIQILAKIFISNGKGIPDNAFPSSSFGEGSNQIFKSEESTSPYINKFTKEILSGYDCKNNCYLLVEVKLVNNDQISEQKLSENFFKISITNDLVYDLDEESAITQSLEENQKAYFRINVPPPEEKNGKLVIRLTIIGEGDSELLLKNNTYNIEHAIEKNDQISKNLKSDIIELDYTNENQGYHIITVFGLISNKFIIQYTTKQLSLTIIHLNEKLHLITSKYQDTYVIFNKFSLGQNQVILNFKSMNENQKVEIKLVQENLLNTREVLELLKRIEKYDVELNSFQENIDKSNIFEDGSCESCAYVIKIPLSAINSQFSLEIKNTDIVQKFENKELRRLMMKRLRMRMIEFTTNKSFNILLKAKSYVDLGFKIQLNNSEKVFKEEHILLNEEKWKIIYQQQFDQIEQNYLIEITSFVYYGEFQLGIFEGDQMQKIDEGIIFEFDIQQETNQSLFLFDSSIQNDESVTLIVQTSKRQTKLPGFKATVEELTSGKSVTLVPFEQKWCLVCSTFETKKDQIYLIKLDYPEIESIKIAIVIQKQSSENLPILIGSALQEFEEKEIQLARLAIRALPGKNVLFQIFNCVSDDSLSSYFYQGDDKSRKQMISHKYNSNHDIMIFEFNQQHQRNILISPNNQLKSNIETNVFDTKEEIIYKVIHRGDDGKIQVQNLQDRNIEIIFKGLACIDNNKCPSKVKIIEYVLHISDSQEKLSGIKNCQLTGTELNSKFQLSIQQDKIIVENVDLRTKGSVLNKFIISLKENMEEITSPLILFIGVSATIVNEDEFKYRYIYQSVKHTFTTQGKSPFQTDESVSLPTTVIVPETTTGFDQDEGVGPNSQRESSVPSQFSESGLMSDKNKDDRDGHHLDKSEPELNSLKDNIALIIGIIVLIVVIITAAIITFIYFRRYMIKKRSQGNENMNGIKCQE